MGRPRPSAVRRPPYRGAAMDWSVKPCAQSDASALSEALEVSETTARVLVRRGYGDADDAKAFLAGEMPAHDPFLLGDMAGAVESIKAAIAGGKRICVHGDYDADGICATALAVLILRELGADVTWHLPSRFEEGYGVQRETLARLADEGLRARAHGRLRRDRGRGDRRGAGTRPRGRRHRPPPAGRDAPRLPRRRDAPLGVSVSRALRHRRRLQARRGAARPGPRGAHAASRPGRARDDLRRRPARRREPGPRPRRPARTRAHAEDGAPGADEVRPRRSRAGRRGRSRVPAGAADQRVGAPLPARCGARAPPHRGRRRGRKAGPPARGAEPRAARSRGPDPARGAGQGRGVAGGEAAPARLRPRRRGLARGRDRHRRVAARRALPPAGRADRGRGRRVEGLGPLDRARSTSTAASQPVRAHLDRFGGHRAAAGLSIRPENVDAFADAFAAHADVDAHRGRPATTDCRRRSRLRP